MRVRGVTIQDLDRVMWKVSSEHYRGNLTFNRLTSGPGNAITFTIRVRDSKGLGHKRGLKFLGFDKGYTKGRRLVSACWHAHRDFMIELFRRFPKARLVTQHANYGGEANFLDTYRDTGLTNIGGNLFPVRLEDACDCDRTLDDILFKP